MTRPGPPASPVVAVIVAFGAPELLDRTLSSLAGGPPALVVDNSSDREVRAVAARHGARYMDPGANLGFAGGVDAVLPCCRGCDVLLVNPDATITPDQVELLSRCLHAGERVACVAPRQVQPETGAEDRVGWPFPTPSGAWVEALGLGRLRRRVDFLIGSVLLMRSSAIEDVGPLDERFYPLYAEETDWQRRARDRGWSVRLCPEATATHLGAGTSVDLDRREVHFQAGQERYIRKHHGRTGWWAYRTAMVAGALPRALLLRGGRRRQAARRLGLYLRCPSRVERELPATPRAGRPASVERDPR